MTTKIKPSLGLRRLLENDPNQFLIYAVEQASLKTKHSHLRKTLSFLSPREHKIGWIHVTDAISECDRTIGAKLLGYHLPEDPIDARKQRIFDNGHHMHFRYYSYFLTLPKIFEVEIAVVLRQWPLVGEADVIISHPEFGKKIIELKSINVDQFRSLKEPIPGHRDQLNSYLGLDNFGASSGLVWYESKNDQEIKTFSVDFSSIQYEALRGRLYNIAGLVMRGRLPKSCGKCSLDEYIANLRWEEERLAKLFQEYETWKNLSS